MADAPLTGIRVLAAVGAMPGAVATMMLADYGADVLVVDDPTAQTAPRLATWERGKRHIVLDLLDPEDHRIFDELAAGADVVVVEADAPSARATGCDPAAVCAINPDVVYVAITGFGLDDTRETPGREPLVAAELGAMVATTGLTREGPVFLGHPAVGYSTALVAVIGTLAAVRARVLTGYGDVVDASMLDGTLAQFTMNWWTEQNVSFLADRRTDGQLNLGRTRMLVRRYRCADGRDIQVHTGANGAFARLMTVLGVDDRISPPSTAVESASWLTDDEIAVIDGLDAIFLTRTSEQWLADIWANDIAALPVLEPGECFTDPQVECNGLVGVIDDAQRGPITVVGPPIALVGSPAVPLTRSRPAGPTWEAPGLAPVVGVDRSPAPLGDVRIVELSTFFAGPYATRLLRDLGASIIKVEPLSGDPMRSLPDPFEGASRGKRSIAVDIKHQQGRRIVEALVATADVVQHNFRPGVAERLGVDEASLRAIRPELIYATAPGFGSSGPKSALQSFAPLHSGFVGVFWEAAGEGNLPTPTFGNEDYYNGQLNAVGLLLALIHRDRTGSGQAVECAQLNSSVFVTSHWSIAGGQRHTAWPRLDHEQWGWGAYVRLYQCLEGYVCVCAETDAEQRAQRLAVLGDGDRSATADEFQDAFYGDTAHAWVTRLRAAGAPCTVATERMWIYDFLRDPRQVELARAVPSVHHAHGQVSSIGRIVQLRSQRPCEPVQAAPLGEHSRAVLAELGWSSAMTDQLVADGIVVAR